MSDSLVYIGSQRPQVCNLSDLSTSAPINAPLKQHYYGCQALETCMTGNPCLALAGSPFGIDIVDLETLEAVVTCTGHSDRVHKMCPVVNHGFDTEEPLFVSCGLDHHVRFWNLMNGRSVHDITTDRETYSDIKMLGSRLYLGNGSHVSCYDLDTGTGARESFRTDDLSGHVTGISVDAEREWIAHCTYDSLPIVWEASTRNEVYRIRQGVANYCQSVRFVPDTTFLILLDNRQRLSLYDIRGSNTQPLWQRNVLDDGNLWEAEVRPAGPLDFICCNGANTVANVTIRPDGSFDSVTTRDFGGRVLGLDSSYSLGGFENLISMVCPDNALDILVGETEETPAWVMQLRGELKVGMGSGNERLIPCCRSLLSVFPNYNEETHAVETEKELSSSVTPMILLALLSGDSTRIDDCKTWHELYELFLCQGMKKHAFLCCRALLDLKKTRSMYAYLRQVVLKQYNEKFGSREEEEEEEEEEGEGEEEEEEEPSTPADVIIPFNSAFALAMVNSLHLEESPQSGAMRYAMRARLLEPIANHSPQPVYSHCDLNLDLNEEDVENKNLSFASLASDHFMELRKSHHLENVVLRVEHVSVRAHLDVLCIRVPSILELMLNEDNAGSFVETGELSVPNFPAVETALEALVGAFYTGEVQIDSFETGTSLWGLAQQNELNSLKRLVMSKLKVMLDDSSDVEETVLGVIDILPRELLGRFLMSTRCGMSAEDALKKKQGMEVRTLKGEVNGLTGRLGALEETFGGMEGRLVRMESALEEILARLK